MQPALFVDYLRQIISSALICLQIMLAVLPLPEADKAIRVFCKPAILLTSGEL
ncbi:hypothetical protein CSB69_3100 [Morganella morganii]|nr:hypothetical protein CSB69_3100 [Morganella morganii]EMP53466.1 hypothetical protein C790_01657 [Morganella morganii SC01]ETO44024.1 hypothetical protein X965_11550 [Morganella sp. EGD-HP17]